MRRAPPLHTHAQVSGVEDVRILKVLSTEELASTNHDPLSVLLHEAPAGDAFAGSYTKGTAALPGRISVSAPRDANVVSAGDIVRVRPGSGQVSVLYRRGSRANSLFVTERCNSLCLMCSQPPRDEDDTFRIGEMLKTISLVDKDETQLGFTGGEPTLLGDKFAAVLKAARDALPETHLHVLTNGRRFSEPDLARTLSEAGGRNTTTWAIPLYADVAPLHDEIVGASGAFRETLAGLCTLANLGARVEIRVVLHAMSIPRLRELVSYIYRRMSFVEHVALMGLEPMGLARVNRARLHIDAADYAQDLGDAVHYLAARGMNVSIYNLPFCVLPKGLWQFARQSISDWKNVDDPACAPCALNEECAGFFLSSDPAWRSRAIQPIHAKDPLHEMA